MTETRAPVLILIPRTHSARARDQLPVPGSVDASGEIFTEGNRERAEAGQAEPGHRQPPHRTGGSGQKSDCAQLRAPPAAGLHSAGGADAGLTRLLKIQVRCLHARQPSQGRGRAPRGAPDPTLDRLTLTTFLESQ